MNKKVYRFLILMIFIITVFSSCVFGTETNAPILVKKVEISSLKIPQLNETIDKDVTIKRTDAVTVSNIVWYKDGLPMFSDTFDVPGVYVCRIYLDVKDGYILSSLTEFMVKEGKVTYAVMAGKPMISITFTVKEPTISYPKQIRVGDFDIPKAGKKPDYALSSDYPEFYTINKVEWYKNNSLMNENDVFRGGTYKCRVYITTINGFSLYEGLLIRIGREYASAVTTTTETYIETEYFVEPLNDDKYVSVASIIFEKTPSFGLKKESIMPKKGESKYYDIDEVIWYKDNGIMYEDYFYSGTYKCRVYLKFINGGYSDNTLDVYMGDSFLPKPVSSINGRYFAERSFTIKEPYIKTFEFNELKLPEYGGIQDNKIESVYPGMYIPSMVYWYKDGKFMSNVDVFEEGMYTCKFTLTVNNECIIDEKANAKINGLAATVTQAYNTITVEMNYEVKKPNMVWTNSSDWSKTELEAALNHALIPQVLHNKDYTQSITRAEFAAVAVKLYERLAYKTANPISTNPFTDTNDVEILKAYALGITNGTSSTTFEPNSLITRQEMATMMVRALTKAGINTNVNLSNVSRFSDHDKIDGWALNGVYFMSNIGIIKGVGNNTFDVFGNATREEALAISIRSVNKFK
ncbi:MAG: S-layer homology domain-containing protein [Clostridia bacterium]|nr:S-layer homology domain-containing protein [Clostridia bacterium]